MARISSDGLVCVELPKHSTIFALAECYVAFANGKAAKNKSYVERLFNDIVYRWTNGVTHAELAFQFVDMHDNMFMVACNLYLGEALKFEFKTRQYANTELWTLHRLELDLAQKTRLFSLCQKHVQRNLRFNLAVYWNFLVPKPLAFDGKVEEKAWCSEHVAHCLREIGLAKFQSIEPHLVDPGTLLELVKTNTSFYGPLQYCADPNVL